METNRGRGGVLLSTDKETDRVRAVQILACVHCGVTWIPQPGSGIRRGFCTRCMGDTCGQLHCELKGCLPNEAQLEQLERGIPFALTHESLRPIVVAVPAGILFIEG